MRMPKSLTALPALVLMVAIATACDDSDAGTSTGPARDLVVEFSDWNGWEPDHQPTVAQLQLKGGVGEQVRVEVMGGIDIEVVEVDGDEITIETSEEMAPQGDSGGVNLNELTDTFVVTPGSPAVFATATLDGGYDFEVRVDDGADRSIPAPGATH